MIAITNILCPIDFSDTAARAMEHAAAFAGWYEARLTVLHVVPGIDEATRYLLRSEERGSVPGPAVHEAVTAAVRDAIAAADLAGPDPAVAVDEGRVPDVIVRHATALGADLLVMGTHGRGGFNRLLLGSVTEKVMRSAGCPVLTVPPSAPAALRGPVAFKRILCAVDFSPASRQALAFALDLGRQADGCVTVLHALEYVDQDEPCEHIDAGIREYRERLIDRARAQLHEEVADEPRTWCEIEEVVAVNRAYREILRRASDTAADLIVMGAQGHGGVELMLYGSNTQHVVRRAACPVLTVHG